MYDELVTQCRDCIDCLCGDCKYEHLQKPGNFVPCMNALLGEAADAIEELLTERDEVNAGSWKTAFEIERDEHRWIPVTEEPPLKVGDDGYNGYLVYANGYYEVADYTTDKFDNIPCFHVDGEYEPDVTHFMPLPEPPKEGDNK